MKKAILALALGTLCVQVLATDKHVITPPVETNVVEKTNRIGKSYNVIEISLSNLLNFKGDEFAIEFSLDGKKATIRGESYRRRDAFDKLERNEAGNHYRDVFEITVQLPLPVQERLRGKKKSYNNNSKYFSKYKHKKTTTLVIVVPAGE